MQGNKPQPGPGLTSTERYNQTIKQILDRKPNSLQDMNISNSKFGVKNLAVGGGQVPQMDKAGGPYRSALSQMTSSGPQDEVNGQIKKNYVSQSPQPLANKKIANLATGVHKGGFLVQGQSG